MTYGADISDAKILLVDDSKANGRLLGRILGDFEILTAYSGHEALEFAPVFKPDLILLDIQMPGMNGFEVCRQLRESAETRSIPIIFLTGMMDSENVARAFKQGAVDFITKPFDANEIKARVKTHLNLKKTREFLELQNSLLEQKIREQQINITLARNILRQINSTPDRYVGLSDDTLLFTQTVVMPCHLEGGDHLFVRSQPHDENFPAGRTLISIKDQSGHAVNCVLRSIVTDLTHSSLLKNRPSLSIAQTTALLNSSLKQSGLFQEDDFCTALTAELDHATGTLRYVTAGHPPFFLIREDSVTMLPEPDGKRNLPLAVFPEIAYGMDSVVLQTGDKLLLLTDGVMALPCGNGGAALANGELHDLLIEVVQANQGKSISHLVNCFFARLREQWPSFVPFSDNNSDDDISFIALELEPQNFPHELALFPKEYDNIDQLIDFAQTQIEATMHGNSLHLDQERLTMVLSEAILNAWKHGNNKMIDRRILVRWRFGNDLLVSIADDGQGFDLNSILDPAAIPNREEVTGRGIYIIRKFSNWTGWGKNGREIIIALADERMGFPVMPSVGKQLPLWA